MGFCKVQMMGHIATEPIPGETKDGNAYARFLMIANTGKEKRVPLNVTAFGFGAHLVKEHGKGTLVYVDGDLSSYRKTDADPYSFSISANRVDVPRQPEGREPVGVSVGHSKKTSHVEDDLPF